MPVVGQGNFSKVEVKQTDLGLQLIKTQLQVEPPLRKKPRRFTSQWPIPKKSIYSAEAKIIQEIYPNATVVLGSNENSMDVMTVVGISIGQSLEKIFMNCTQIQNMLSALINRLTFLHGEKGIFHGDIKIENVLECKDAKGVVSYDFCDWGSAGHINGHDGGDGDSGLLINPELFMTAINSGGTIAQAYDVASKGGSFDKKLSDIHALFGCAYQMLEKSNLLTEVNVRAIFSMDLSAYKSAVESQVRPSLCNDISQSMFSPLNQLIQGPQSFFSSPEGSPWNPKKNRRLFSAACSPSSSESPARKKIG